MRTPFPSNREKIQESIIQDSVPSKFNAAVLCKPQSPPEGIPCGSKYVSAVSLKLTPLKDTDLIGFLALEETEKSTLSFGTTNSSESFGEPVAL